MRKLLIGLVLALTMNSAAADISSDVIEAFNSSMQGGDKDSQIAAASNLAAEAMTNPEDEMAALLAYEAAWTLCTNDNCEAAIEPAEFSRKQPVSDPAAHPVVADRELLVAYTNWKIKQSRRHRRELDTALASVVHGEPSMLSLTAFQARYIFDIGKARAGKISLTAGEAATHYKQVDAQFPHLYIGAEMAAIAASFNDEPNADAQRRMAHLEGHIGELRAPLADEEEPAWLRETYYNADAWLLAMQAHFSSTGDRGASKAEIAEILKSYRVESQDEDDETGLPFCNGGMNKIPTPHYPSSDLLRGRFGSVLIGFDIAEGELVNLEVLAAIPDSHFAAAALKSLESLRWEAGEGQPTESCSMSRENVVYPFVFQIGR